jgi:hypothetical protein
MRKLITGFVFIVGGAFIIFLYLSQRDYLSHPEHWPVPPEDLSLPPIALLVVGTLMVLVGIVQLLVHKDK